MTSWVVALLTLVFLALAAPAAWAQNALGGSPAPAQDFQEGKDSGADDAGGNSAPSGPAPAGVEPALSAAPTMDIEYLTLFDSDILIGTDGTLTVRESITINAKGDRFRHGILRDFPTDYKDRLGNRVRVGFEVQSVTRDGHDEPYTMESLSNGRRVKVGSADVLLDNGPHTYVITYTTNRQIGFFEKFDELYWNVTGNGWEFAIGRAVATVHLPPGAHVMQTAFYTGRQGESGHDATQERIDDSTVRFTTNSSMGVEEGLTVAVAFTKGVVAPPTASEETRNFLLDNASTGMALFGLIALALYFGFAWWTHGRDPERGTIVPLFAPPKNLSPSAVRYVHKMGYDRKAFAAALIDMAVKGYLTIKEEGGAYTLKRTKKSADEADLATAERAVANKLFAGGTDEITLKQTNHTTVQSSISALQSALRNEDEGTYFVTNSGWFFGGIGIVAVSAIATALLSEGAASSLPILLPVSAWSIGAAFMAHRAYVSWQSVSGPGFKIFNVVGAVFTTFFAVIVLFVIGIGVFSFSSEALPHIALAALALQGVLAFVFYRLMKAPTVAGQKVRDEIDGFKMFLETAEKDRLEMLHPPKVTPEVFEKFLPYAIALDAENQWSKKFEADAAEAGIDTAQGGYTPVWYVGPGFSRMGTTGFTSAIGTAVASAAASAAVAPGSSSGSGGGGFSGGGGGGGGGGGW